MRILIRLLLILAVSAAAQTAAAQNRITCESQQNRPQYCPADTRGGVRLARQLSDVQCREGINWGYDYRGIWVDRGCRAEFELTRSGSGGGGWGGLGRGDTITCASEGNQPNFCAANTRGGVRLSRQISNAPCREGDTWGYDRRGIWVTRGCRGEFEVRGYQGGDRSEIITCSSENMRRQVCPADTRGGVRLARQISDADCRQGSTWGFDSRGIWVDRGCRGEFEVSSGNWGWPGGGWGGGGGSGGGSTQSITCESRNGRRQLCPANINGTVRVARQLSDTPCRERENWGYNNQGIWVDRGCRAVFEITDRDRDRDRRGRGRDRGRGGFERLQPHEQACEDEVLRRIPGLTRGDVEVQDATQGSVGTQLVEWRTRNGVSGYCRVNPNNRVVQFNRD